jgi:hypothetical protein
VIPVRTLIVVIGAVMPVSFTSLSGLFYAAVQVFWVIFSWSLFFIVN